MQTVQFVDIILQVAHKLEEQATNTLKLLLTCTVGTHSPPASEFSANPGGHSQLGGARELSRFFDPKHSLQIFLFEHDLQL